MSGVRRATPRRPAAASRTSAAVTRGAVTLLAGTGPGATLTAGALAPALRRAAGGRLALLFVPGAVIPIVLLHNPCHVHHQIARGEVHDADALRVPAGDPDPF